MSAPFIEPSAGLVDAPLYESTLALDLLHFYDDFVNFHSRCAFLCDAIKAMTSVDMDWDDEGTSGLHIFADEIKESMVGLKKRLRTLQENSRLLE